MLQRTKSLFRLAEPWIIWFIASLFYMHQYFLRVSVLSLSPSIVHHFHVSAVVIGNISASFFYTYLVAQLFAGITITRFGVRPSLMFAASLCAAGCFLIAMSSNVWIIIVGRMLLGVGGAFSLVGALTVAHLWFTEKQFAWINGLTFSMGTIGALLAGSPLALYITEAGWRDAMWLAGFICLGLVVLDLVFIREHHHHKSTHKSLRSFKRQFIKLREVVKTPNLWLLCGFSMFLFLPMAALANLWIFHFLRADYHAANPIVLNIASSMIFLGYGVGSFLLGYFYHFFRSGKQMMFYFTLATFILSVVIIYVHNLSLVWMCVLLFMFGFFISSVILSMTIIRKTFDRHKSPIAFSLVILMLNLGGAVSLTLIGSLLDLNWHYHWLFHVSKQYSLVNFYVALSIIPLSVLISLLFLWRVKEPAKLPSSSG